MEEGDDPGNYTEVVIESDRISIVTTYLEDSGSGSSDIMGMLSDYGLYIGGAIAALVIIVVVMKVAGGRGDEEDIEADEDEEEESSSDELIEVEAK